MRRKTWLSSMIGLLTVCSAFAQSADPVVLSYQRNFVRASIATKAELLNDAARATGSDMSPLYLDALQFVRQFYPIMGSDAQLIDIGVSAAGRLAGTKDPAAVLALKDVFMAVRDSRSRIACLEAFSSAIPASGESVRFLDEWFSLALNPPPGDQPTEAPTLAACARTLGKIGNVSSFPALFRAATGNYDTSVVAASADALNSITVGYTPQMLGVIAKKQLKDIYAAFSLAMKKNDLPDSDRGQIAEAAFKAALDGGVQLGGATADLRDALIRESLASLTSLAWAPASGAVIQYFYQVQGAYAAGNAGTDNLLAVIRCMGASRTSEAAQALSIYLGLLNSETEQKKTYNEQLLLAVLQALGDLGDKTAFDYLLYVGYLDYPETVIKASRDALARLAW